MNKVIATFGFTVIIGVIGIFLGASIGFEGYLGNIFAIATIGAFIVSSIESLKRK